MQRWTEQTAFTSPGRHAAALAALGGEPQAIVSALQTLLVHGGALSYYGVTPVAFSRKTLPVETRLGELLATDPRPLAEPRLPQARALVTCRDYATLVCSALRSHGKAARVRCGFATYLGGSPWEDHWICELWTGERWRRIDAQLDPVLQKALQIEFAADEVPPNMFLTGDEAWRVCRTTDLNPEAFAHGSEASGLWFVVVNMVRDHLALADQLTSEWDSWRSAAAKSRMLPYPILAAADELAAGGELTSPLLRPWWIAP